MSMLKRPQLCCTLLYIAKYYGTSLSWQVSLEFTTSSMTFIKFRRGEFSHSTFTCLCSNWKKHQLPVSLGEWLCLPEWNEQLKVTLMADCLEVCKSLGLYRLSFVHAVEKAPFCTSVLSIPSSVRVPWLRDRDRYDIEGKRRKEQNRKREREREN